ncbi:hypothetical protein [Rosenbergiella metrosideri]|nr:hypothetical protein [Rosenbergiella metrosideri]
MADYTYLTDARKGINVKLCSIAEKNGDSFFLAAAERLVRQMIPIGLGLG